MGQRCVAQFGEPDPPSWHHYQYNQDCTNGHAELPIWRQMSDGPSPALAADRAALFGLRSSIFIWYAVG